METLFSDSVISGAGKPAGGGFLPIYPPIELPGSVL